VHHVSTTRARRQRGSVLMLMPAAVLVLVVLASIAVDFAIVGMGARELHNAAAAAANDAATAALSSEGLRSGETWVDTAAAQRVAARSLAARGIVLDAPPQVSVSLDGREVTVTLRATYDYVFAPAIPGAPDEFHVEATATARAVVADDG
jgi:Flp pilus assembly protein TadG